MRRCRISRRRSGKCWKGTGIRRSDDRADLARLDLKQFEDGRVHGALAEKSGGLGEGEGVHLLLAPGSD
jgi:hypothetical protein